VKQPMNLQKMLKKILELTVDTAIIFLRRSFKMYKTQDKIYGFLHNINTINAMDGTDIKV
jgi:hypothetical protein